MELGRCRIRNSLRDTHRNSEQNPGAARRAAEPEEEDDVEENSGRVEQIEKQRGELEKAKKMLEDTLNYRRTLQHMTKRLKEERLI